MNELLRQDAELQGYLSGIMLCALSNETDTEHYQELLTSAEKRIAELKQQEQVDTAKPC